MTKWIQKFSDSGKDGNDFTELISQLLIAKQKSTSEAVGEVAAYFDKGHQDGGIDIYNAPKKTVWQCKLPEAGKQKTKKQLIAFITKEATKLRKQLEKKLDANSSSASRSWFDEGFLVDSYVFCIGSYFSCHANKIAIEEHVIAKFKAVFSQPSLPSSRHKIKVILFTAEHADELLNDASVIRLDWFEPEYPSGVTKFAKDYLDLNKYSDPLKRSFKSYLHSDNIPYVPLSDASLAPSALLQLLDSDECTAVLLDGTGGQGKTRLAHEVAIGAIKKEWLVYSIYAESLSPDTVKKLATICKDSKTLLVIDYAEKTSALALSLDMIANLNSEECNFRLFLTCREQYGDDTAEILSNRLDNQVAHKHLYSEDAEKIVNGILAKDELVQYRESCKGQPVFAAFVYMMSQRNADKPLAELRQLEDFRIWLSQHVSKLPSGQRAPVDLAALLSALPASREQLKNLNESWSQILTYKDSLFKDGWLDYDHSHDQFRIAHDVIADGAMLEILKAPRTAYEALNQYFDKFKVHEKLLSNLISSWGRISSERKTRAIEWHTIFTAARLDSQLSTASLIANTDLIDAEHYASWLYSLNIDHSELIQDAGILRGTGASALKLNSQLQIPKAWENWLSFIAINAKDAISTAPVLSRGLVNREWAIALAPALSHWTNAFGKSLSARFIYRSWLKVMASAKNEAVNQETDYECLIENHVKDWINQHQERFSSSEVISAWIEAGNDLRIVETGIQFWSSNPVNTTRFRAGYLHLSWLKRQGQIDTVAEAVRSWLNLYKNYSHDLVLSVFSGWIEAAKRENSQNSTNQISNKKSSVGEKVLRSLYIQESLIQWLSIEKNRLHQRCFRIYWGWLEIESDITVIRSACIEWLNVHGVSDRSTESLLSAYCRRLKNEPEALKLNDISIHVQAWLAMHGDDPDTDKRAYFLKLNYSENRFIEDAWDKSMQTLFIASPDDPIFVNKIIQYLKNKNNAPDTAWPHLKSILDDPDRCTRIVNGQVFKRWLERTQLDGLNKIRSKVTAWLDIHGETKKADAVLEECLEIEAENQLWSELSLKWLKRNYQFMHKDAFYIYRAWFRSQRPFPDIKEYFDDWIKAPGNRLQEKFEQLCPLVTHYGWKVSESYVEFFPSLLASKIIGIESELALDSRPERA